MPVKSRSIPKPVRPKFWLLGCGRLRSVVNPLLLEGQVQGGLAQGVGQALLERCVYDESGQLVSGSFMDYCMPRADDLPNMNVELVEDYPCVTNPLGIKGAGEAGAVAAPPTVINAILDALSPLDVTHIDMPATLNEFAGHSGSQMTTAEKLLTELEALAIDAGNAIMRADAEDFVAEYKDDYSPVTEADTAAEEIIIAAPRLTPDIPVVAEEAFAAGHSPDISGGRFWLVDPLDGTHEFVEKNGEFTVNIALIEDGRPICGVVHAPALGQTYTGHIETGAYCRDAKTDLRDIRIRPSPRDGAPSSPAAGMAIPRKSRNSSRGGVSARPETPGVL